MRAAIFYEANAPLHIEDVPIPELSAVEILVKVAACGLCHTDLHYTSLEPYEGMHAFVEKRRPDHLGVRQRAVTEESSEFLWGPYTQACPACGAKGIPSLFVYCGHCGAEL